MARDTSSLALRWVAASILVRALTGGGCAEPPRGALHAVTVDSVLVQAFRRGQGAPAVLDSVGPADWQYLYVFGPRTSMDAMRRCVGESHGFESYGVDHRDDIDVLIFKSAKQELSSMNVPHATARFGEDAFTREYGRGDARFVVRRNRAGVLELAPSDTSARRCT